MATEPTCVTCGGSAATTIEIAYRDGWLLKDLCGTHLEELLMHARGSVRGAVHRPATFRSGIASRRPRGRGGPEESPR